MLIVKDKNWWIYSLSKNVGKRHNQENEKAIHRVGDDIHNKYFLTKDLNLEYRTPTDQ